MKRNLKTVRQFVDDSPFTDGQVRFWIFDARNNGLAGASAVVRVRGRVYLDVDAFDSWIDQQQETAA